MPRPTTWNQDFPQPKKATVRRSFLLVALGGLAVLLMILGASALRGSMESPRLAGRIFQELSTEDGARTLYQRSPGLQAGYGSEEAFLQHLRTWKPCFGNSEGFNGPDKTKRYLPFATKLEIKGSNGAWFAVQARLDPFPRLHGAAFGSTREEARRTCFSLYAKTHMLAWLDRGLAHAHELANASPARGLPGLETSDLQRIRALPLQARALDPTAFEFQFASVGARLDLELESGRILSLRWKGEALESEIEAILGTQLGFE